MPSRAARLEAMDLSTPGQRAAQRAKLGQAPEWAHHLHDCLHEAKRLSASVARDLKTQRGMAVTRQADVDKAMSEMDQKLDTSLSDLKGEITTLTTSVNALVTLFGEESSDGKGGRGLLGKFARHSESIRSLESDRSVFRGFLVSFAAVAATLAIFFKAWIVSIVSGVKT